MKNLEPIKAAKVDKQINAIKNALNGLNTSSPSALTDIFRINESIRKLRNITIAALGIGGLAAGGYYFYNSDDSESDMAAGVTGDQDTDDQNAIDFVLNDPERSQEYFEEIKNLEFENPNEANRRLNLASNFYRSEGYIPLDSPIQINGYDINYIFPRKFRGGRDPLTDRTRQSLALDKLIDIYTNSKSDNLRIKRRLESEAGSTNPQVIANYAFSVVFGAGLFSGKGTFMGLGDRGSRYGRGRSNKGFGEFGLSGTGERKMTREERRSLRRGNEAYDSLSKELDLDDPMNAFSSSYNEYFLKKSNKIDDSTNNLESSVLSKKADKISNRYFKDAVKDLEEDEFMKQYYAGYSKLHNEKRKKPKLDYEKLYDLHDETGPELIHKSHQRAISVAEAIGDGGLVENLNERSKSMQEVAMRTPSGNYRARYASVNKKS